jgi:hypothetical protein
MLDARMLHSRPLHASSHAPSAHDDHPITHDQSSRMSSPLIPTTSLPELKNVLTRDEMKRREAYSPTTASAFAGTLVGFFGLFVLHAKLSEVRSPSPPTLTLIPNPLRAPCQALRGHHAALANGPGHQPWPPALANNPGHQPWPTTLATSPGLHLVLFALPTRRAFAPSLMWASLLALSHRPLASTSRLDLSPRPLSCGPLAWIG